MSELERLAAEINETVAAKRKMDYGTYEYIDMCEKEALLRNRYDEMEAQLTAD
jgi:hypothetical protein